MKKMTKGLRETIYNYLLASAIFLSPIVFPLKASAEILEKKVLYKGKEYNITIDSNRQEYSLQPDIEEAQAREMLASSMLENLVNETKETKEEIETANEEFFWQNPSKMQLKFSESIPAILQNILEFQPYEIPKTSINVCKKSNELDLDFKLESQDYSFDWYKRNSIGIFFPKGTSITRKVDEAYVLAGDKDKFDTRKIEMDKWNDEREAYGKLADFAIKKILEKSKHPFGIAASTVIQIDDLTENDLRRKREEITENLKRKYDYRFYTPAYFFATPEQGRLLSINFDGKPDSFVFFINSEAELKKAEYGTQTKKSGALAKIIEVSMNAGNITDDTPAGKIARHAELISKNLDELIQEYEHKKQLKSFDLEEKGRLYGKLSLWNAQIQPFITMLASLKNKEIKGNPTDLPEYQKFQQESNSIIKNKKSLDKLIGEYFFTKNYLPYLSNPRKTFDAYKKAMSEKNWKIRDKTNFDEQLFLWEKWLQDKKSLTGITRNEIAKTESLISSWRFIKEMPYTSDIHKEFVNKNTVEAGAFVYKGYCNILFARTKEGWKLDRGGKSEPALVRAVCSVLNEIGKNWEMQKKIISDDISYNFLEPSIFSCHYSNFSKLSITKQKWNKELLEIRGALECYDGSLNFRIKEMPDKVILYHYGPDNKDDNALVQYNPEKNSGKGDIWISIYK